MTYIAGPMRGYPNFNFEAFYDAEEALKSLGWTCLNPARIDREQDGFNPETTGNEDPNVHPGVFPVDHYIRRDFEAIMKSDAIHMLPGWQKSKGASAEHALAVWRGIPVIYL